MRERLRTKSEGGEGLAEKAGGSKEKGNAGKKVSMLQTISFTARSANSISQHDAEYLKHLTSVKVRKLA